MISWIWGREWKIEVIREEYFMAYIGSNTQFYWSNSRVTTYICLKSEGTFRKFIIVLKKILQIIVHNLKLDQKTKIQTWNNSIILNVIWVDCHCSRIEFPDSRIYRWERKGKWITIFIASRDLIFKNINAQSLPSIGRNLNKLILEVMKQI